MAGLVPAIHVFLRQFKTWMSGTTPGMTIVDEATYNFSTSCFIAGLIGAAASS